jgi:hypothetical protein
MVQVFQVVLVVLDLLHQLLETQLHEQAVVEVVVVQ